MARRFRKRRAPDDTRPRWDDPDLKIYLGDRWWTADELQQCCIWRISAQPDWQFGWRVDQTYALAEQTKMKRDNKKLKRRLKTDRKRTQAMKNAAKTKRARKQDRSDAFLWDDNDR